MSADNIYQQHLDKTPANYVPLTPLSFLKRSAQVFPDSTAIRHGSWSYSWREAYDRCRRLASALDQRGIGVGDTVAVMAPNTPPMWEAHFGVPMTGAVLNALNVRLDAATIAYILDHGEASLLITDTEFAPTIKAALDQLGRAIPVVDIADPQAAGPGERLGGIEYEDFLAGGDPAFRWRMPEDEWEAITLNYTSGTTGNPKGVVYHHRGAYLNAVGNILTWSMGGQPVYLWTLPMFHCNGWCFPWTVAAMAGTSVCLRQVAAKPIYDAIADEGVTHLCGAPIVMQMLLNAEAGEKRPLPHTVNVMTAAAPPPASVLERMETEGFKVTHVYGLTEVYGPAVTCAWHAEWNDLPMQQQAEKKARQGVAYPVQEDVIVADQETMEPLPWDGKSLGEVLMRGNIVMKGYLKNPEATDKAFADGWYHTGDLGVTEPDGYIALKDRSKDIIISGGENISSIEVENVLYKHPAVAACSVVAMPSEQWGETPCAFVELAESHQDTTAEDLIAFARQNMAKFKAPRQVVFEDLPKTSTGKIQKFQLRERAKEIAQGGG
ncbi:acyl-CoA synthetase [Rhodovibrio sodomensis]|uniref:Acyl-CoA synthetase n=1 Tax=Rhodovibrio sodomensis TaxID=1088 RepID=A0ABS1DL42_9PROT|nr:acyl-CoA synthetase [Rhodovibrio sodomensis]MBK1671229.1 acyl-CoA synthetase [Rhodovibrio sodomensis]